MPLDKDWLKDRIKQVFREEYGESMYDEMRDGLENITNKIFDKLTEEPELDYTGSLPHLELEDSGEHTFGLLIEKEAIFNDEPRKGVIVGMWSKSPITDSYVVWLQKAVDTMVDGRVQWWAKRISDMRGRRPDYSNYNEDKVIEHNGKLPAQSRVFKPHTPLAPKGKVALDSETGQFRLIE